MKDILKKGVVAILTFEARMLLKRKHPKIIAITGSVGKTSTKDAIYSVLKNHVHARKSEKSFNSDIGVALTILGLRNGWNNPLSWFKNIIDGALHAFFSSGYPEVLVLEMGVDRPGDMKRLTEWIKPDVVVVTRLPDVPAHVEYFSSPQEIIDEKMTLVRALKSDGAFVYNHDDEKIHQYLKDVRQQAFGYSRYSQSHFTASGDTVIYDGSSPMGVEFTLTHVQERVKMSVVGSLGVQHAYNYAAAVAVGMLFDISMSDAVEALKAHVPPPGRMRVHKGIQSTVVIDDTYNSSPVACEHALQTLAELKTKGRKIAILGDMLELGQFSVREHERMGELLAPHVDLLFTIGVRAKKIAEGAIAYGFKEENVVSYDDVNLLVKDIIPLLKSGDIVLVKASQGMRAEKIVEVLLSDKGKASEVLVRQDTVWMKK